MKKSKLMRLLTDIILVAAAVFNFLTFLIPYGWLIAVPLYIILISLVYVLKRDKEYRKLMLFLPISPLALWVCWGLYLWIH